MGWQPARSPPHYRHLSCTCRWDRASWPGGSPPESWPLPLPPPRVENWGDRILAPLLLLLPGSCSSLQRKRRSAVGGVGEVHQQSQVRPPPPPPLVDATAILRSPGSLQRQRDNKHTKRTVTQSNNQPRHRNTRVCLIRRLRPGNFSSSWAPRSKDNEDLIHGVVHSKTS